MERVIEAHPTFLAWTPNVPTTVRDCLLHAVPHSALHQGHIQLTCHLLSQREENYRGTQDDREIMGTPVEWVE